MKRILLLLCALLLTGCAAPPSLQPILTEGTSLPLPQAEQARTSSDASILWFRYADEPVLAPERRIIETDPTISYERALLTALLGGPEAGSTELSGLFPTGTRVLSTHLEGRTLFVTLSRGMLRNLPDEPDGWRSDPYWRTEIPLRRELAMQSIAATVTENCPVDTVIILVEQGKTVTDSLRLRESYYQRGGDEEALAAPLTRDESVLLTAHGTAERLMTLWQTRDFLHLHRYVSPTGRLSEEAFLEAAAELPHLVSFTLSGGSVQGRKATFSLSGIYAQNGEAIPFGPVTLRLTNAGGLWKIDQAELLVRKEALP